MNDRFSQWFVTITLSHKAISNLCWLCDAKVDALRNFIAKNSDDDDVADAENDVTYFEMLAKTLRDARDSGLSPSDVKLSDAPFARTYPKGWDVT